MRKKFLTGKGLGRVDAVLIAAAAAGVSAASAWGQATSLPSFNAGNLFNVMVANPSINGDTPASTGATAANNATAINAYISYVSGLSGGGTVEIPSGTFNSNLITMRSNVNLQLDSGAVLASGTATNTLIQTTGSSNTNMEISGSGIINGRATTTVSENNLVTLSHVTTLEVTGVSIENAPHEHLVTEQDSNVTISNVNIADPGTLAANKNVYLANTDAMDFSGSNFTIKNCTVNAGDDDICAKPASTACSNILITNDTIGAGHGISVGGGTGQGVSKMTVSNCVLSGTSDGLRLKAQDSSATGSTPGGGTAHPVVNVLYSNIVMTNVQNPIDIDSFYGVDSSGNTGQNNFPSSPTQTNYAADSTTPIWDNIGFNNVYLNTTSGSPVVYDLNTTPSNLNGLSFNNVNLTSASAMNLWWGSNINLSGLTVNHAVNQQDLSNVTPAGAVNITWNNAGSTIAGTSLGDGATWDTVANENWNTGTTFTTYTDSSNVTFNDTNSGHYSVALNSTVSPLSTTINNSSGAYTISGSGMIAGAGSLTKTGTAAATISTSNAYTGGTIINGGTLIVGSASALGAGETLGTGTGAKPGATTVNTNGTLDLNGMSLTEPITLNGGTLTNSNANTAAVVGGMKGVGYTTNTAGIGSASTITFNSGIATAAPVFGITSASFSGFTGSYANAGSGSEIPPQAPVVLITPSDGNGSGAMGYAVLSGNSLVGVTIVYPGSGYDAAPIISFVGGNATVAGSATGNANNFALVGIQTTSPGSGYTSTPTATLNNVGGTGTVSLTPVIGSVTLASTSSIGGNAGNIALALPITGAGGLIKTGSDTLTISGNASYLGNTQINQGTLAVGVSGSISQSSLNVNTGGTLSFTAQTGGTGALARTVAGINITGGNVVMQPASLPQSNNLSVLVTPSLNITSGTLDLTSNDLIVKGTTPGTMQAMLKSGFNVSSGYWNGTTGIVSSAAANDTSLLTTLGYATGGGSFDNVPTTASDVLVKYTYYGDANLDGVVNGADYQQIDNGFGLGLTGWQNGDFNYDGVVDGSDFSLIDNTFNQLTASGADSLAIVAGSVVVPEPATLGLLAIGGVGLLLRRRRNAER